MLKFPELNVRPSEVLSKQSKVKSISLYKTGKYNWNHVDLLAFFLFYWKDEKSTGQMGLYSL